MQKLLTTILLLLCLGCCPPPISPEIFEFTDEESSFLNPLRENDTVFLECPGKASDTIIIGKLFQEKHNECAYTMQRAPGNLIAVVTTLLPDSKIEGAPPSPNRGIYQGTFWLFQMKKDFDRASMNFQVELREFISKDIQIGIDSTKTIHLKDVQIPACYVLTHLYPERITEDQHIAKVYWTKKDGMVAYENRVGEIWINKNLNP